MYTTGPRPSAVTSETLGGWLPPAAAAAAAPADAETVAAPPGELPVWLAWLLVLPASEVRCWGRAARQTISTEQDTRSLHSTSPAGQMDMTRSVRLTLALRRPELVTV
jgi:hypothetical protein